MSEKAGKIRAAIIILGMGLALYWCFTYSGPYRYLAEVELKHFGSYSPKLTLLVFCLLFVLIGELARIVLRGAEQPAPGVSVQKVPSPVPAVRTGTALSTYRPLILVGIPFVMGAYFCLTGASAGQLRELHIADFADGTLPSHTLFAEVHGYLDRSYLALNNYHYVPLRESPTDSAPVRIVIGVNDTAKLADFPRDADGSIAARGMLHYDVDNEVRYDFQKHGITVAEPAAFCTPRELRLTMKKSAQV